MFAGSVRPGTNLQSGSFKLSVVCPVYLIPTTFESPPIRVASFGMYPEKKVLVSWSAFNLAVYVSVTSSHGFTCALLGVQSAVIITLGEGVGVGVTVGVGVGVGVTVGVGVGVGVAVGVGVDVGVGVGVGVGSAHSTGVITLSQRVLPKSITATMFSPQEF